MDDYVDINGGTYHTYCVKCAKCGEVIEDYIVEEDGLFYHKDCYNEDFVKCDLCGAYIYDEYKYIFQGYVSQIQAKWIIFWVFLSSVFVDFFIFFEFFFLFFTFFG